VLRAAGADGVAPGARAALLDRDGTLNESAPDPGSGLPESPLALADVRLIPGAAAAAGELARAGYALVCVSNQPAAAKGKVALAELLAVYERVIELLAEQQVRIAASFLCPHHPDGVVPELSGSCECRKPAAGMLLEAASMLALDLRSSWMLGDTDSDVAAGRAAGCATVLIEYPGSAHKRAGTAGEDVHAADIGDGVAQVLARAAG
jgi:D-glycero-D-manno-heptose 1,7-bisphosphate phosphatase